jgi:phosphoglycolate phosphatase-like HAD superfamily hydrolase
LRAMTPRLVLFDIDGTLLATGGAGERALRVVLEEHFNSKDGLNGIEIAGRTDSLIAKQVLKRFGVQETPEAIAKFLDLYLAKLTELLPLTQGRLLPGIVELLEALKAKPHMLLGLLTGNLQRGAELKLAHYGVWNYFEFGAYADDHHDRNELGPFAMRRALEKHGVEIPPRDVFVLGDTPHDVACARAIGAQAIAVATGGFTREALQQCEPDFLFDDFSDVPAVLAALES